MNRKLLGLGLAALLLTGMAVRAEDTGTGPAKEPKKEVKEAKEVRKGEIHITQPWAMIPDLSDDQKTQIKAIHEKSVADMKATKDKEDADITALLTDAQKKELADAEEAKKAAGAAKMKEHHEEKPKAATTQPGA